MTGGEPTNANARDGVAARRPARDDLLAALWLDDELLVYDPDSPETWLRSDTPVALDATA